MLCAAHGKLAAPLNEMRSLLQQRFSKPTAVHRQHIRNSTDVSVAKVEDAVGAVRETHFLCALVDGVLQELEDVQVGPREP